MIVILGLGNPGRTYVRSRHNAGFLSVRRFALRHGIGLSLRRRHALIGIGSVIGEDVVLAQSRTYMNMSGIAARYLLSHYRIVPDALLVIHDDMDLPVGKLRLSWQGGSGGHKGIGSIISELGTQQFPRLRIGIGRPGEQDSATFVLGDFTSEEHKVVTGAADLGVEAVIWMLEYGLESAMNRYN
jgi:PTH1 family peptidyl-tRNA hydrolase